MKQKHVKIEHCPYCNVGRIIYLPRKHLAFCSLCGKELRR